MPRIPLTWLAEHATLPRGADAESVAGDLVSVGLEEEAIFGAQVTGPLVVGRVLDVVPEPQKNGKTINWVRVDVGPEHNEDRKSTRLNSSHVAISYAVFCLKKKKTIPMKT